MSKKETCLQALLQQKLLPLYYHENPEKSIAISQALYGGGIRILEYTNRGNAALENFKVLRQIVDASLPGLQLGIGTIKSPTQASNYIAAGADFIVCPSMNADVAKVCADAQLLWIPGCMTPTEIAAAENEGAALVKIFPGTLLGPSYISAVKDLFPGLRFIITGGVEAEESNLKSWFKVGVVGVGMGSKLITKDIIDRNDFEGLQEATAATLELVERCQVQ